MALCMVAAVLGLVVLVLLGLLLAAGYTVLPQSFEDRYRATFYLGYGKIFRHTWFKIYERLGWGTFFDNILTMQAASDRGLDGPPRSASYGKLEVKWDMVAGQRVLIYRPRDVTGDEMLPCLVYVHGGGWCMDNPIFCDHYTYRLALMARMVTIGIHYRRTPKHPFPAPFNDCMDVVSYVLEHGKTLGVDVNRVGLGGDSAGGNMAAALHLYFLKKRQPRLPPLKYQLLVQPITQALNFRFPSYLEVSPSIPLLSNHYLAGFWALYLGLDPKRVDSFASTMIRNRHCSQELRDKFSDSLNIQHLPKQFRKPRPEYMRGHMITEDFKKDDNSYDAALYSKIKDKLTDWRLCPLVAPDVSGLPPTLVLVNEYDVLRDEGLLYAHRLKQAGVQTQVYIGAGFHGDFFCCLLPDWTGINSKSGEKHRAAMRAFIKKEH